MDVGSGENILSAKLAVGQCSQSNPIDLRGCAEFLYTVQSRGIGHQVRIRFSDSNNRTIQSFYVVDSPQSGILNSPPSYLTAWAECLAGAVEVSIIRTPRTGGFSWNEVPDGAVDGVNIFYALSKTPFPPDSLHLFRNGLNLKQGEDYTLGGRVLVFTRPPKPGENVLATYLY